MSVLVPTEAIEARAIGAYLGLAVGDALGATVEFMTPREIQATHGTHREMVGGGWLRLRKGRVTDDTEMSLALGRALLGQGLEAVAIAEAFSDWMRARPVDIGHTVRRGLSRYRRTGETEMPPNEYDAGNGACMRTLPIALYTLGAAESEVEAACRLQARITHHHPLSDAATLAVTRLVQEALLGAEVLALLARVEALIARHPEFAFRGRRVENPGGYVVETLRAVFQALFDTDDFESALVEVVNRGGDADTTGAILGMIAGALHGPEAIPARWLAALEADTARACREQAVALLRRSPWAGGA